jgi:uncharacterized Zn finger protein
LTARDLLRLAGGVAYWRPFENRCTCPQGGNCRHVVTLGLTFLHQERQRAGSALFPADEACYYQVSMLEHDALRGLAMQLLASVPEAVEVTRQYLDRPGSYTDTGEYTLDEAGEENDGGAATGVGAEGQMLDR